MSQMALTRKSLTRRQLLKLIYQRRSYDLEEVRSRNPNNPHDYAYNAAYGRAVTLYSEARQAWRKIRGFV